MSIQTKGLLSPFLQKQRIKAALKHINGKVCDFGCGDGKLAAYIDKNNYIGVDRDSESIKLAAKSFPDHNFSTNPPPETELFDTIVSLAVIEHFPNPENFLNDLKNFLKDGGSIILTTPHPSMDFIHYLGSKIGLFSQEANEEHEELLGYSLMKNAAEKSGLKIVHYKKFLFGANQLFVLKNQL